MTEPMPSQPGPAQTKYTGTFVALRKGLETTVAQADFSPEGTRRVIQGGPSPEPPVELPSESESGLLARVDLTPATTPAATVSPSADAPDADEALPQAALPDQAATEPRSLARAVRSLEDVLANLAANTPDRFSALNERVLLAIRICQAVATVHASGVLLNDLKPALIGVGLFGEVSLVDRGSATPVGASGAKVTGTPAYMSPEQARGEALSQGSDLYALGATIHRLFTLRYPLWETDPERFWERKRRGELDAMPEAMAGLVPTPLLAICRHAMEPQAADRYLDAATMALDLQCFLEGKAVSVVAETQVRRVLRAVRRHGQVLAAVALVVLAAISLLSLRSGWKHERERLLSQVADKESVISAQAADGAARAVALRRQLEEIERQRGWRQVVDLDFTKPIDARLQAVQVNEGVRIESEAVGLLRQADGVLEILPAPHRTFVRWSEGVSEDARIDLEVESPGAKGWNLDITVAGDPLNGYRLRLYDQHYMRLESISRGWADELAKVEAPPIANRERLTVSLQHSAGRIIASIDGKVLIDYIDPAPLVGPAHRCVAVGRFFSSCSTRIRRMTVSSRVAGELVGILDPGIALMRQGQAEAAKAWFARVAAAPPSERTRAEALYLAALAEPAGASRRKALLAFARTSGQLFADRALFVAIDQAVQEDLWEQLPELIGELRTLATPDLLRRVSLNLIGQMQQWRWITPVRRAGLLAAIAATGEPEFRVPGVAFEDLSALRSVELEDVWIQEGELTDFAPLVGPRLRRLVLTSSRIARLPSSARAPLQHLDLSDNPLISIAELAGSPLQLLILSNTQVADLAPLAGMSTLRQLGLAHTPVGDLSALRGLGLVQLNVSHSSVIDLGPLAGMPLNALDISSTGVSSLAPLAGCAGRLSLVASGTAITDLSPLHGVPLTGLDISGTEVQDLGPLAGTPLERIRLAGTRVRDLAPLAGCPLQEVNLAQTAVTDLSPLGAAPLRALDLSGRVRGSLLPLMGKSLDVLHLPSGPYSGEQLGQFARLKAREVVIDPAASDQWAAAEQIQGVLRINGLLRSAALARREACRALLAGQSIDLGPLAEPLPSLRLVLLPILATREEAVRLAGLAGGRLPCLSDQDRYRQMTSGLYRALARSNAPVQVGVVSGADGLPQWIDGTAWRDRPLRRADLAQLAVGGTTVFDVNRPYEVLPAATRTLLAIELR